MDKSAEQMVNEIKQIDNNINDVLVPLLKDTINDYKKIIFRLVFVIVFLIVCIVGISVSSQIMLSKQTNKFNEFSDKMLNKYNEFLSQFEFESEEHVYQNTDDNSVINSGITFSK